MKKQSNYYLMNYRKEGFQGETTQLVPLERKQLAHPTGQSFLSNSHPCSSISLQTPS